MKSDRPQATALKKVSMIHRQPFLLMQFWRIEEILIESLSCWKANISIVSNPKCLSLLTMNIEQTDAIP